MRRSRPPIRTECRPISQWMDGRPTGTYFHPRDIVAKLWASNRPLVQAPTSLILDPLPVTLAVSKRKSCILSGGRVFGLVKIFLHAIALASFVTPVTAQWLHLK